MLKSLRPGANGAQLGRQNFGDAALTGKVSGCDPSRSRLAKGGSETHEERKAEGRRQAFRAFRPFDGRFSGFAAVAPGERRKKKKEEEERGRRKKRKEEERRRRKKGERRRRRRKEKKEKKKK